MSRGTDFSFTFDPPVTPRTDEDLFAVPRLTETPHDAHSVSVQNPHNGRRAILPLEVANALTYCSCFRTLEGHVSEFVGDSPPSDPRRAAIREVLGQVQQDGLMISARETLARFQPTPRPAEDEEAVSAAIITCDRPFALERLLDSIVANSQPDRMQELVVVDDSRSESNQRQNRRAVEQRQADFFGRVRYFGAHEAQRTIEQLVRALPHIEAEIRFLLDREKWATFYSAGVARNWSHILSIGRKVAVFDDDTVCELWRSSSARAGCELNQPRRQALFYDRLEDEPRLAVSPGDDPIAALTDCLGLTLAQSLDALSLGQPRLNALKNADPDTVMRLSAASRILVSECGSVGDPGTADYKWLALLPDETLERMSGEPEQAARAVAHARCWLGADWTSYATDANMSQLTGFDNREILPPYMPVDRGQDQIFGEMVQFLYPGSICLNHNWAIKHLRVDPDTAQGAAARQMSTQTWLSNLTLLPARRLEECTASGFGERLQTLSSFFSELAGMPADEIVERATAESRQRRKFQLEEIQRRLDAFPELPQPFQRHLQELAASYDGEPRPVDRQVADTTDATRFWTDTWGDFGKALVAWPEIRQAATNLQ